MAVAYHRQIVAPYAPEAVGADWQNRYSLWMQQYAKYQVVQQTPGSVVYHRRVTPGAAVVFAILLFPIGLVLLLLKRDEYVNVQAVPYGTGSTLTVNGAMDKDLVADVEQMLNMTQAQA